MLKSKTLGLVLSILLATASAAHAAGLMGTAAPKALPPVTPIQPTAEQTQSWISQLRSWHLQLPLDGINPETFKGSFYSMRGHELHHASDMLAPRNTPIHAVEDGTIARLFLSRFGGNTIYEVDPTGQYVYYYAHLQNYADNLRAGDHVRRGQVIGFVGTSGNAPPNCPHLHFSVERLAAGGSVFHGTPVDPYEVFSVRSTVSKI